LGNGVAAAILAGGKSKRMGQHKALLPYEGKPLIEHLLARLKNDVQLLFLVGCPEPGLYRDVSVPVVTDALEDSGPLGGILSALRYVHAQHLLQNDPALQTRFAKIKANKKLLVKKADIKYLLVLPCDGIQLPRLFVSRLVRALERQDADVVYARDAMREQHLYCLLKIELADSLQRYIEQGGRKVIDWFQLQHYAVEDFSTDGVTFSNLNTPDDWQLFLSQSS
jgi:molybdopterin-guanine dinucleotide biosynthesis protein A